MRAICPEDTLLDVVVTKDTSEDNLVHVTCHWIFDEQLVGHLVDAHEHEGKLSCRSIILLLGDFLFGSLSLSFLLEFILDFSDVFLGLGFVPFLVNYLSELLGIQLA